MTTQPLIAGNWKMHKTAAETAAFIETFLDQSLRDDVEIAIAPPFTALATAAAALRDSKVALCAQNVAWDVSGAFTGEIAAPMLLEHGVKYVIVGHSERRQNFGESDDTVNKRTRAALASGLNPIVCVGETLAEREAGQAIARVQEQTRKSLFGISRTDLPRVTMAYEPIWAVGTGKNCDAGVADHVMAAIAAAANVYGMRVLYGGSVKPGNIREYDQKPNIDGALVGGASLDPIAFAELIANF